MNISTASENVSLLFDTNMTEVMAVGHSFMVNCLLQVEQVLLMLSIVFGIPCNIFVLYRMYRFSKFCPEVFSNGIGVCLFSMVVADIISLASIAVHCVLSLNIIPDIFHLNIPPYLLTIVCKTVIFSTHVSTSASIWSWLLMSVLRYLSVYHPLVYIRLWRLPRRVLSLTLGGSILANFWLLPAVQVDNQEGEGQCTHSDLIDDLPYLNHVVLFIESVWSFVIPTATIVFLDTSVYMCSFNMIRKSRQMERSLRKNMGNNTGCPTQKRNRKTLWHWLIIALIDVVLNVPENIFRLILTLGWTPEFDYNTNSYSEVYQLARGVSQLLYYLQFSFNGVYLALFIYDKSTNPSSYGRKSEITEQKQREPESIGMKKGTSKVCYSTVSNLSEDEQLVLKTSQSKGKQLSSTVVKKQTCNGVMKKLMKDAEEK